MFLKNLKHKYFVQDILGNNLEMTIRYLNILNFYNCTLVKTCVYYNNNMYLIDTSYRSVNYECLINLLSFDINI